MNNWQFTAIVVLYIATAIIAVLVALLSNGLSKTKGTNYFILFNLSIAVWTIGYILGLFNTQLPVKLFMLRIEYIGIVATYVFWFLFIAAYTHTNKWLKPRYLAIILFIPFITIIQVLFIDKNNLFFDSYEMIKYNGLVIAKKDFGTGFYIHMAYSYLLSFSGIGILVWKMLQMPDGLRNQSIPIIAMGLIFFFPNILFIIDLNPIAPYDPTSISFAIIGLLFLLMMYHYRFLDIVPVAYHLVFRNTKSGVVIIDMRGIILDLNSQAEFILNNRKNSAIGKKLSGFLPWFDEVFNSLSKNKEHTKEIEVIQGDEPQYFEVNTNLMNDQQGNCMGCIVMFYEITKRRAALNELDAYARTVAHNLKNPMNAIHGFVSLLNSDITDESEKSEYIENLISASNKATEIIDNLLLLARVRNYNKVTIESIDMKSIIDRVLQRLSSFIDDTKAVINRPEKWPNVLGNSFLVEEMWVNYIINALKYGGSPPIVNIGYEQTDHDFRFYVQDQGQGINEKEIKNLFQEFSRLKSHAGQEQGYGLGLAIVKRIAKCLGGKVGVESTVGEGSLFYFTLPDTTNNN